MISKQLYKIDPNKLIKGLFFCYIILLIMDCATTVYGFEIVNITNCALLDDKSNICEHNPHIYNSEGAIFHLIAMIGIASGIKYLGLNYRRYYIKTMGIAGLEFLVGLTMYAVVNNIVLFLLIST